MAFRSLPVGNALRGVPERHGGRSLQIDHSPANFDRHRPAATHTSTNTCRPGRPPGRARPNANPGSPPLRPRPGAGRYRSVRRGSHPTRRQAATRFADGALVAHRPDQRTMPRAPATPPWAPPIRELSSRPPPQRRPPASRTTTDARAARHWAPAAPRNAPPAAAARSAKADSWPHDPAPTMRADCRAALRRVELD